MPVIRFVTTGKTVTTIEKQDLMRAVRLFEWQSGVALPEDTVSHVNSLAVCDTPDHSAHGSATERRFYEHVARRLATFQVLALQSVNCIMSYVLSVAFTFGILADHLLLYYLDGIKRHELPPPQQRAPGRLLRG
jgi:hypothetical protein